VDLLIQKLEDKAQQPPRICWRGEMLATLETLGSQSLESDLTAAIQLDSAMMPNCNNRLVSAGSQLGF